MESLILNTLMRMRQETPRRLRDLRTMFDTLIAQLKTKANGESSEVDTDADKYFEPLRAACESRVAKVMEIALDAIHILIERGYLRGTKSVYVTPNNHSNSITTGTGTGEEDVEQRKLTLMDLIVDTISKCSDEFDDGVQLQVINALLTAITSPYCEVHEASLLLAIRACFHIHLITKNHIYKQTAKGALTQMLSAIFRRMEIMESSTRSFRSNSSGIGSSSTNNGMMEIVPSKSVEGDSLPYNQAMYAEVYESLGFRSRSVVTPLMDTDAVEHEAVANNRDPGAAGTDGKEAYKFPSVHHKDSFLVFRALCKLSMKGLHDDTGTMTDPIALQNKLLSLELLLHILQNSGFAFKTGPKFIETIQNTLCVSLLGNCTSQVAEVTGLGLHIFVMLMSHFKDHLKNELEIFISKIFLKILETEYSSYDHKMKVLEVFHNIAQDPVGLVEMFVNYDCEEDTNDVFSNIVDAFAKIAKNPNLPVSRAGTDFLTSNIRRTQLEEKNVKAMGLEGLVIILRSLLKTSGLGLSPSLKDVLSNNVNIAQLMSNGHASSASSGTSGIKQMQSPKKGAGIAMDAEDGDEMAGAEEEKTESVALQPVANFDRKQKIQEEIDSGILKFNLAFKTGIKYLVAKGHIEHNPNAVAKFFHQYKDRLDKSQVGEYLGKEREYEGGFCLKVLHEYVDMMDFNKLRFDEAIRYFLSGFRIPGEAQKIDRIMEKFAERYYLQNRDVFASADMAFILAFSTIMLQTNLHNPAIKDDKRMTKEQFIKQNKGISADGELPEALLVEIYENIAARPISMTTDDSNAGPNNKKGGKLKKDSSNIPFTVFSNDKRRKEAFHDERREMVRAGEVMIKQARKKNKARGSVYVRTSQLNGVGMDGANMIGNGEGSYVISGGSEACVKPMFEISWAPMLGVFSQILETSDDPDLISLCLTGFLYAIRLSSRMSESIFVTARQSFINALTRFTMLETVKEMKAKNIECIRALIYVALCDAEYLEESWFQILQCISQLARLILIGNGLQDDGEFMSKDVVVNTTSNSSWFGGGTSTAVTATNANANAASVRRNSIITRTTSQAANNSSASGSTGYDPFKQLFGGGPSKAEVARNVEETNAMYILQENIDEKLIDRIIVNSQYLSSESVCHFIESLCEVSKYEITNDNRTVLAKESAESYSPRIFGLQKLVEVADYNMHKRHRVDWARMWSMLANHFSQVGCHDNFYISMYAIDSLKQLSIKFLQKEELSNFNFQRLFLKPFEVIMTKSRSNDVKDIILNCLDVMIRSCAVNIRSGWRTIFSIFEVAASCEKADIAKYALTITDRLLTQQFDLLVYDFVEIVNCLVTFVSCIHTTIALAALTHLGNCAKHLVEGTIPVDILPAVPNATSGNRGRTDSHSHKDAPLSPSHAMILPPPALDHADIHLIPSLIISEDASVFRLWWPLLLGLAARVADPRYDVRSRALDTIAGILSEHGTIFSAQAWSVIFKGVLFPIMDSATTDFTPQPESRFPRQYAGPNSSKDKDSWIGTSGLRVITTIVDLFQQFKIHICCNQQVTESVPLLSDLIGMLEGCIFQDIESLARLGLYGLRYLMKGIYLDGDGVLSPEGAVDVNQLLLQQQYGNDGTSSPVPAANVVDLYHQECSQILCYRLCNIAYKSLCLDFGEAGKLAAVELPVMTVDSVMSDVTVMYQCPIAARYHGISTNSSQNPNTMLCLDIVPKTFKSSLSPAIIPVSGGLTALQEHSSEEEEDEEEEDIGEQVMTPYGMGVYAGTASAEDAAGLPVRKIIQLSGWQGQLYCDRYTFQSYLMNTHPANPNPVVLVSPVALERTVTTAAPISWRRLTNAIMTSMVVTLDMIDILNDIVEYHPSLPLAHVQAIITTLHIVHAHAKLFNKSKDIRLQLKLRHFMEFNDRVDRLPHLLDQEVKSSAQLLQILYPLYLSNTNTAWSKAEVEQRQRYARVYIMRLSPLICQVYLYYDNLSITSSASTSSFTADSSAFVQEQLAAYTPSVMYILQQIYTSFTVQDHFIPNIDWILPMLTSLNICNDRSIRKLIMNIYEKIVNPHVLQPHVR